MEAVFSLLKLPMRSKRTISCDPEQLSLEHITLDQDALMTQPGSTAV